MNADAFADERTRDRLLRDVPQRRTGRLDEIGPLAVYLASAASDFMTGQTLFLDGGYSAV
jgi:NAD(P)-dependent dehydrogenase (short-subunit alcohol dehydrogenase family)